ncbi:hypothetical protein ACYT7O_10645, partial [Streptococcus pyogenes]
DDAGFALKPYLMTTFRSAEKGSLESGFNKKHAEARCFNRAQGLCTTNRKKPLKLFMCLLLCTINASILT